jgi:hypothetical protein
MANFVDHITQKEITALQNISRGSIASARTVNINGKPDQWTITYLVPEEAHHDIQEFQEGIRQRIFKNLGTEKGVFLGALAADENGKETITATFINEAFQRMNLLEEEVEKAANDHGR